MRRTKVRAISSVDPRGPQQRVSLAISCIDGILAACGAVATCRTFRDIIARVQWDECAEMQGMRTGLIGGVNRGNRGECAAPSSPGSA